MEQLITYGGNLSHYLEILQNLNTLLVGDFSASLDFGICLGQNEHFLLRLYCIGAIDRLNGHSRETEKFVGIFLILGK